MIGKFEYIHGQKHISTKHTNQQGRASQQLLVHTYYLYHYLYVEFVINEEIWPSSVVIAAVDSTAARLHFGAVHKVVRILKKRAREMSRSSKVSRTFGFLRVFGAAEKN